jgi:hypothetical protein
MKAKLLFAFIALLLSSIVLSQATWSPQVEAVMNNCTQQTLSRTERQLCGDTACLIGGNPYTILSRHWNSAHNSMATQFIFEQFQAYGYTPYYMNFSATGRNVYAKKIGTKYPNQQYIICGHFDNMPSGSLAPGSDDNASGTSAVMEAARLLANIPTEYTVLFIAFDEEERGLYGSHAYADTAFNRGDSILFVFNYDMISWDGNNNYAIDLISNVNSSSFSNIVRDVYNIYQPVLVVDRINSNMSGSDHYWFWQRGYKAFCGIEDNSDFNPYYHTVNDNYAHVQFPYFHGFVKAAVASLLTFGLNYQMTFTHTPIVNTSSTEPQIATVVITAQHPLARLNNAPRVYYKINNGSLNFNPAYYNNLDTFKFQLPGVGYGTTIAYYFAAQDTLGRYMGTLPLGGKGITPPGSTPPPTMFTYQVILGVTQNQQPAKYSLEQNYPNPFNASTNIKFNLHKAAHVKLVVTDLLGREVETLINSKLPQGENTFLWYANNCASGIYFYSMYIDGQLMETKKMILSK